MLIATDEDAEGSRGYRGINSVCCPAGRFSDSLILVRRSSHFHLIIVFLMPRSIPPQPASTSPISM